MYSIGVIPVARLNLRTKWYRLMFTLDANSSMVIFRSMLAQIYSIVFFNLCWLFGNDFTFRSYWLS